MIFIIHIPMDTPDQDHILCYVKSILMFLCLVTYRNNNNHIIITIKLYFYSFTNNTAS